MPSSWLPQFLLSSCITVPLSWFPSLLTSKYYNASGLCYGPPSLLPLCKFLQYKVLWCLPNLHFQVSYLLLNTGCKYPSSSLNSSWHLKFNKSQTNHLISSPKICSSPSLLPSSSFSPHLPQTSHPHVNKSSRPLKWTPNPTNPQSPSLAALCSLLFIKQYNLLNVSLRSIMPLLQYHSISLGIQSLF